MFRMSSQCLESFPAFGDNSRKMTQTLVKMTDSQHSMYKAKQEYYTVTTDQTSMTSLIALWVQGGRWIKWIIRQERPRVLRMH